MSTRKKRVAHLNRSSGGWKVICVEGDAKTRGFMHGAILANELKLLLEVFPFELRKQNIDMDEYTNLCNRVAKSAFDKKCSEWREELEGMVEGAISKGVVVSVDFLFGWNMYLSIGEHLKKYKRTRNSSADRCCAFIATGDATKDGRLVMAHNTHCEFTFAQFYNVIQYTKPSRGSGHGFIMQTCPGLLCSSADWFLCESGIIGCETTIANINYVPLFGTPYFCRIRECMQYAKTLDDCERIMREDNAGDYPCAWLFGDSNTNEIMMLEVAKTVTTRRTASGVFYGANFAHDKSIRENETANDCDFLDSKSSIRNRAERLDWLLNKVHWGNLDASTAKLIISDHYDNYARKIRKGTRSICKHDELESGKARAVRYPFGAIDGKVVTSKMAESLSFWGRWGSSCGRTYVASKRTKRAIPYLPRFRNEPWTVLKPRTQFTTLLVPRKYAIHYFTRSS